MVSVYVTLRSHRQLYKLSGYSTFAFVGVPQVHINPYLLFIPTACYEVSLQQVNITVGIVVHESLSVPFFQIHSAEINVLHLKSSLVNNGSRNNVSLCFVKCFIRTKRISTQTANVEIRLKPPGHLTALACVQSSPPLKKCTQATATQTSALLKT